MSAFGVTFVAVDPGDMDTDLHAEAVPDADRSELQDPRAVAQRLVTWLADGEVPAGARVKLHEAVLR